jgi:hypothetical protein
VLDPRGAEPGSRSGGIICEPGGGSRVRPGRKRLFLAAACSLVVFFQDVKRVSVMVLHADSAKDGPNRACGAALFPDYLAHIRGGNPEPEHRALFSFHRFDKDCIGNINQRSRNLSH